MKFVTKTIVFSTALSALIGCTAITDVTSSTSSTLDTVTPDITLNNFIDKRYDAIRKDAAAGGGENIDALAQLMGQKDTAALASWMQENYEQIFSEIEQPSQLVSQIEAYKELKRS
jgi:hypothetical protein